MLKLLFALFLYAPLAHARHVSYLGGTSFMSWNRPDWSELMVSHTALPRLAPGLNYRVYRDGGVKQTYVIPTLNALAVRLNENSSQTNLYLSLGTAIDRSALLVAADGDWETRRLYTEARYEALGIWRDQPIVLARVRAGFAPDLAEMEGLHSFVLLQSEYESRTGLVDWTPMIRLSYSSVLIELGFSQNGVWHFNWSAEI